MQLYINEWPQIEPLVNNNNDYETIILNTNKLYLFIISKLFKYNMVENFEKDLSDKIDYLKSENIISNEITELFNESNVIIKIDNPNNIQIERLLFLRKEILEWFLREYKNHENIHNLYGEKVFKNYKNNNLHYHKNYKKNKDIRLKSSIENKNRKNINKNLTTSNNKVKNQELVVFDKNNNCNKKYKKRIRNIIKNLFKNIIKFNSKERRQLNDREE